MKFVATPACIADSDVAALRELADSFPASAIVQMLYLRALHNNQSYQYQKQLKLTALVTSNRHQLFAYLHEDQENLANNNFGADSASTQTNNPMQPNGAHGVMDLVASASTGTTDAPDPAPAQTVGIENEITTPTHGVVQENVELQFVEAPATLEENFAEEVALPAQQETAAQVMADGTVNFDLDRVDARTRAVIERSLALREKLALKKQAADAAANSKHTEQQAPLLHEQAPNVELEAAESSEALVVNETNPQIELQPVATHFVKPATPPAPAVATEVLQETTPPQKESVAQPPSDEIPVARAAEQDALEPQFEEKFIAPLPPEALPVARAAEQDALEPQFEEEFTAPIPTESLVESAAEAKIQSVHASSFEDQQEPSTDYPEMPLLVFNAQEIEAAPENQMELVAIATQESAAVGAAPPEATAITPEVQEPHTFFEWMQLLEKGHIKQQTTQQPKGDKLKLIDAFLQKVPSLKPRKEALNQQTTNFKVTVAPQGDMLMTETLANVYVAQKHYDKALAAFEILRLKYPEKSSYFADLILKVKKLKNSPE